MEISNLEGGKIEFGRWKAEKWNLEGEKAKCGRWKAEKSNLEAGRALMGHHTKAQLRKLYDGHGE